MKSIDALRSVANRIGVALKTNECSYFSQQTAPLGIKRSSLYVLHRKGLEALRAFMCLDGKYFIETLSLRMKSIKMYPAMPNRHM